MGQGKAALLGRTLLKGAGPRVGKQAARPGGLGKIPQISYLDKGARTWGPRAQCMVDNEIAEAPLRQSFW